MTTPSIPDLSGLIPSKWKAVVALIGTGLSFILPFVLEATSALPSPWPAIIGAVLWLLTAFGVLQAPYLKPGTVAAPVEAVKPGEPVVTAAGKVGRTATGDEHQGHVHTNTLPPNDLSGYVNPFPPLRDQL